MKAGLVAAVLLAFAAAPAIAQPSDPAAEERARVLYEKGTKHYDLAEYDEAIAAFKDAYKELKEPLFLYNIAQAYRQKRDCVNAVKFYKTYLRGESEGATADQARAFVTELDACAKEQSAAAARTGTGSGEGKPATGNRQPATGNGNAGTGDGQQETGNRKPETGNGNAGTGTGIGDKGVGAVVTVDRGKTKRLAGMIVGGVGVFGLVIGGMQAKAAGDAADELARTCTVADPCEPGQWQNLDDKGAQHEGTAVTAFVVGGVAIAAGAGLYVWGRAGRAERTTISITPTPGGVAALARFRF